MQNKNNIKALKCPNCGAKLMRLMPDGEYLHCNKCYKNFANDNGKVGKECSLPIVPPLVIL